MKIVAFVPIKLKSKRLSNKNILPLGGRPLCYYIFNTLLKSKFIDNVCVYCSDEVIKKYIPKKVNFLKRDKQLDGDFIKGLDIYHAFADNVDGDIYVLAHATSPFLAIDSVDNSLDKIIKKGHDSAFSVTKHQTFAWYDGKPINYKINDIPRTQDLEPIYVETSGFFIYKREVLKKHNRRIGFNPWMQEVDNIEGIDIDTKEDFEFAKKFVDLLKG